MGPLGRAGFRINKIECCSALGSHPRRVLDSPDAILPESSVSLSVGSVFPWAHFPKTPPSGAGQFATCASRISDSAYGHAGRSTQVLYRPRPDTAPLQLKTLKSISHYIIIVNWRHRSDLPSGGLRPREEARGQCPNSQASKPGSPRLPATELPDLPPGPLAPGSLAESRPSCSSSASRQH